MTLVLDGQSVSRGIVLAPLVMHLRVAPEIREEYIDVAQIEAQVTRYGRALLKARQHLQRLRERIPDTAPADISTFIDTYLLMLNDSAFAEIPLQNIRQRLCTAEWALQLQRDELVSVFEAMADPYLQTRKDDVDYMVACLQQHLREVSGPEASAADRNFQGCIVVADDFSPEDVMLFHHEGVLALVSEAGGANSHAAILARSLGLPTIVACHGVKTFLLEGELLLLDAGQGIVIAAASAAEQSAYLLRAAALKDELASLDRLRQAAVCSQDGQAVSLQANIEIEADLVAAEAVGADGVGLFRTEMLFIERQCLVDEEGQFQAYRRALRSLGESGLTIRTLDIGADKSMPGLPQSQAGNPALGLRSIRFSLHQPDILAQQLRAILRVSALGSVRMMLPMLSSLEEVEQVRTLLRQQYKVLDQRHQAYDPEMAVGGMIEVPAAALMARSFANVLDFLSIGTNDLIQYTLAVDRLDDEVSYLYNPLHPAVLRLIRETIVAAQAADIPVAVCGELAGDTRFTRLLLALGLRQFSMSPAALLGVKQVICNSHIETLEEQRGQLDSLQTASEVTAFVAVLNALH